MDRFLVEWGWLEGAAKAAGISEVHAKVTSMAERCADEVHLYLKFRGD